MAAKDKKGFWTTLDLLVGREWRRTGRDTLDEVDDWLETVVKRRHLLERPATRLPPAPGAAVLSPVVSVDTAPAATANGHGQPPKEDSSGYSSWQDVPSEVSTLPLLRPPSSSTTLSSLHAPKITDCRAADRHPRTECGGGRDRTRTLLYRLRHPHVRARLERLMENNTVRMTDRKYMMRLQQRIRDDYYESLMKRIGARAADEMERQKHLVLTGKIPFDQAPREIYNHPVLKIERHCNKLIAARRALIKVPKVVIPKLVFLDESPDPPTGLTIACGHRFNPNNKTLLTPHHYFRSEEQDMEAGYMFTAEEYERLHFETPAIKQLRQLETVEELYTLAEDILALKNLPAPKAALIPT